MQYIRLVSILYGVVSGAFSYADSLSCQRAHSAAMTACSMYEHRINPKSLEIVSTQTRKRVLVEEEQIHSRLLRNCQERQKVCQQSCDALTDNDFSELASMVDTQSDCQKGDVQKHRLELSKRVAQFQKMNTRKPAATIQVRNFPLAPRDLSNN